MLPDASRTPLSLKMKRRWGNRQTDIENRKHLLENNAHPSCNLFFTDYIVL